MKYIDLFVRNQLFVLLFYLLTIFLFYFLFPWLEEGTVFFFRWDEAIYLYIHQQILNTSQIPDTLNYVGGFPNYLYPNLYLQLNNLLIATNASFNLKLASIYLQLLLLITLLVSSLAIRNITYQIVQKSTTALFAGLFFLIIPIASQRLFYLHATFYANFIGISFLLLFIYYLILYKKNSGYINLVLSILFYSVTLFAHQLVFMMATVILGINFAIEVIAKRNFVSQFKIGFLYIATTILLNFGYIMRTPMLQKILNILGIVKYEQFGQEVITKTSASNLPPLLPSLVLGASFIAATILIVRIKGGRQSWVISGFFYFTFFSILLNKINIHLPASFRYDTFFIVTVPVLLSIFIFEVLPNKFLKTGILALLFGLFSLSTSGIKNGFNINELQSIKNGLGKLHCVNTASYYRVAPWIPVMSNSEIYYAHVDIYNAHEDRMVKTSEMLFSDDITTRLKLAGDEKVDCFLYEKNILIVDNIRVKGWEERRYELLRGRSIDKYEDENVAIFKI